VCQRAVSSEISKRETVPFRGDLIPNSQRIWISTLIKLAHWTSELNNWCSGENGQRQSVHRDSRMDIHYSGSFDCRQRIRTTWCLIARGETSRADVSQPGDQGENQTDHTANEWATILHRLGWLSLWIDESTGTEGD
jgi:hypothetical protein